MPITLLHALSDERFFGPLFPSPDWDAWRVFCRALTGAPIPEADLALYRACTGREEPPTRPATEAWVICGRRSGKSRIASAVAAYLAALADTSRLAAGEMGVVMVCAVDKQQGQVILNYIRALFEVPALRALVVGESAEALELSHGVRIEVRSSNFRSVRGVTLLACIVDELAFLRDESSALPDVELYRAVKPSVAAAGGLILGISSPWAQRGLLFQKWKRHYGQAGDVLVWQSDSRTMHPGLSAELVAEALEDDPESAAAEWQGQFRSDLESYVSMAVLDVVTTPGLVERPSVEGVHYVGFVDVAGGAGRDSFVTCVVHAEARADGAPFVVVDALREVRPPFDPLSVTAEAAAFLRSYRIDVVQSDKYAGAWVTEAFARHGVVVVQDAEPKSTLYIQALPLFTSQRCDLLDLPKLRAQFAGLERRRRAGGRDVVDHPPGGHDDVANAVAGALLLAAASAGGGDFVLAANLAPEPRSRVLDDREFALLDRF